MARRGRADGLRDAFAAACDTDAHLTLLTDRHGRVLHFGSEAERISGYRAEQVVGRLLWEVLVAEDQRGAVAAAFEGRRRRTAPAVVDWVTPDGTRRTIAWSSEELREGPGPTRLLFTGTDLTHERLAHGLLANVLDAESGLAVLSLDTAGTITFVSPGAERLLVTGAHDLVGSPVTDLHDPFALAVRARALGGVAPTEALLGAVRHGIPRDRRDWVIGRGDGSVITASVTLSATRDGLGRVTGFLLHLQNVTDEREAQQHLAVALQTEREAVARLEALDEERNVFVATVSHELRTPLTNILGYADVLLDDESGTLTADQRAIVERINRNAERLHRQVKDLQLLSAVDEGTYHPDQTRVALNAVVGSALEDLGTEASRRVDVELDDPDVDSAVLGDRPRLVGVVRGLVDNALKFSPASEHVQVHVHHEGAEQVIEVTDHGIGIASAEQPHLFKRFTKATAARAIAAQGLGLGLAVTAAVVSAHDGTVAITSDEGVGTQVVVRLPSAPAAPFPGR